MGTVLNIPLSVMRAWEFTEVCSCVRDFWGICSHVEGIKDFSYVIIRIHENKDFLEVTTRTRENLTKPYFLFSDMF